MVMRSYRKTSLTCAIAVAFVLFSYTFCFAQYEGIKGVQFKDGSIIYGVIVQKDINNVIIMTENNESITRKADDIVSFIKEDDLNRKKHSFSLGTEISYIKYEEPGYMEDKGEMYGLFFSYAYHNKLMTKIEGKFSYGEINYDGAYQDGTPLTIKRIPDFMLELRWLLGYDFNISKAVTITPNFGVGYRYLQDNLQDKSPAGYQRESNYIYIPMGVEAVANLGKGWSLGSKAEFDIFLWGRQISYLSDVDSGYWEIENEQMKGYGARGSVFIAKKFEKVGFMIEPFIRYWNIRESREAYIVYDGYAVGYGVEPNNNSTEIGCKLAITF
jgi:hypothetical protein